MHARQGGMTLLEVLLAIVIVAAGLFATAAMQLQALQAADSAPGWPGGDGAAQRT